MSDLRSPKLMCLKGVLLLLIGVIASGLLLLEHPSLKVAALLGLAIWGFARAYYFAFYVIERYIDPKFKFAGLWSVARHVMLRGREQRRTGRGNPRTNDTVGRGRADS